MLQSIKILKNILMVSHILAQKVRFIRQCVYMSLLKIWKINSLRTLNILFDVKLPTAS